MIVKNILQKHYSEVKPFREKDWFFFRNIYNCYTKLIHSVKIGGFWLISFIQFLNILHEITLLFKVSNLIRELGRLHFVQRKSEFCCCYILILIY